MNKEPQFTQANDAVQFSEKKYNSLVLDLIRANPDLISSIQILTEGGSIIIHIF